MIKYVMTAAALKFFSLSPQTKHMYLQLAAYKRSLAQFEEIFDKEFPLDETQSERVHGLLHAILKAPSFDDIYALVDEELVSIDISNLKIDGRYQNLSPQDLACIGMRVVHQKANALESQG